jgi:hypothetical protein
MGSTLTPKFYGEFLRGTLVSSACTILIAIGFGQISTA